MVMNERIIKLGLKSGILNYVDHETPRHYFLCGNADEKDLEEFAKLIVEDCADLFEIEWGESNLTGNDVGYVLKKHFGVEK
jgi:hypothetical protein